MFVSVLAGWPGQPGDVTDGAASRCGGGRVVAHQEGRPGELVQRLVKCIALFKLAGNDFGMRPVAKSSHGPRSSFASDTTATAQGEVTMAARVFDEAKPAAAGRRKAHRFNQFVVGPRRAQEPSEELRGRHIAASRALRGMDNPLESEQAQWYLGRWVERANRATDRSPVANLKVGDVGKGQIQQRRCIGWA